MKQVIGLFVGLTTIDFIYNLEDFPKSNSKNNAVEFTVSPGGPAYNAAVAFSILGGKSIVVTGVGTHHLSDIIHNDAKIYNIKLIDVASHASSIPISSIIIERKNGNRTVVSNNYSIKDLENKLRMVDYKRLSNSNIALWDGFYANLAEEIFFHPELRKLEVIMDGGSWKTVIDKLLPRMNIVICSEKFDPPGRNDKKTIFDILTDNGVSSGAITRGEKSIQWFNGSARGVIDPPKIDAVDTLGAGDFFHGAFAYFYAIGTPFTAALQKSANLAAKSCMYFGTRDWIKYWNL